MPEETAPFYCLRCGARFEAGHDPRIVKERACPQCASNSVRRETPAARAAREAREKGRSGP